MTALGTPPASFAEEQALERMSRGGVARFGRGSGQRTVRIRGNRAGLWTYLGIAAVLVGSLFPFYW